MRIEDFKYVETAFGGANNRNHIVLLDDVSPDDDQVDCFTSMFCYRKEVTDHVAETGSIKGIGKFPCWSPFLWFDIDSKKPADAIHWLNRLLRNISQLDSDLLENIRIYFSGNKGFHVGIPSEAFGLTPDVLLPYTMKELARELAFGSQIDLGIYQASRLWRLPGSKHSKSGLYKTLLSHDDVLLLDSDFKVFVEKVSKPSLCCYAIAPPCSLSDPAVKLLKKISYRIERARAQQKQQKEATKIAFIKPCIKHYMKNEVEEGTRNEIAVRIANDLKKRKFDKDEATEILSEWNQNFCSPPLPEKELGILRDSAWNSDEMDYGCNDVYLSQVCEDSCPLKKPEPPAVISLSEKSLKSWRKVAEEIFALRSESGKAHEKQLRILETAVNFLKDRGKFYRTVDNMGFYFDHATKKLVRLDVNHSDTMMLLGEMGLFRAENMFSYLAGALEFHSVKYGELTTIYNTCYYDQLTYTLYVSYGETEIIKITSTDLEFVPNGTDGILFFAEAALKPFKLGEPTSELFAFRKCLTDSINFVAERMTVQQRKRAFECWVFSVFFAEIMPTKPILCFLGEKGSGKSTTLRKIAKLLYGPENDVFMVPHHVADLELLMSTFHFLALDNVDTKLAGLNDALAASATGTQTGKRQLYTDGIVHKRNVRCFLGITSRTPEFTRDDVADRLLLMHLEMLDREQFIPEHMIQKQLMDHRDQILTEMVYFLQRIIKAVIAMGMKKTQITNRIADFGHFATIVCSIFGETEKDVKEWLQMMVYEQTDFALFDQAIFRLIDAWLELESGNRVEITPADLRAKLNALAKRAKLKFTEGKTQRAFAARLRHQFDSLSQYFKIEVNRTSDGHIKSYVFNADRSPNMKAIVDLKTAENPNETIDKG